MQVTENAGGSYEAIWPYIQHWAFQHRGSWDTFIALYEARTADPNGQRCAAKPTGCSFESHLDASSPVAMQIRTVLDLDKNCIGFRLEFCGYKTDIDVDRVHALISAMDACDQMLVAVVQARQETKKACDVLRTIFGSDYSGASVLLLNKPQCASITDFTFWFPGNEHHLAVAHA